MTTEICEECGQDVDGEHGNGYEVINEDLILCRTCFTNFFDFCEDCGKVTGIEELDDIFLCPECHEFATTEID